MSDQEITFREDSTESRLFYIDDDGKSYDLLNLIDALDHIKRICHMSDQMSKRTYWIAQRATSALESDENWREFDYPKNRTREKESLRRRLNKLRDEVEVSEGLQCPNLNCNNQGWYPNQIDHDTWEQMQCEFCYTVPDSVFNRNFKERQLGDCNGKDGQT